MLAQQPAPAAAEPEPQPEPAPQPAAGAAGGAGSLQSFLGAWYPDLRADLTELGAETAEDLLELEPADVDALTSKLKKIQASKYRKALAELATAFGSAPAASGGGGAVHLTFANSNFKREYEESGIVLITKAAQIISKISDFIHVYCYVHGLTSEAQKVVAEQFVDRLQKEAVRGCTNIF